MDKGGTGHLSEPATFVFTDVVGSTRLWAADPEGTARSFVTHDSIVRGAVTANGGEVFGWAGDSFRGIFDRSVAALDACHSIHAQLAGTDWGADPGLRVRIGVTRGQALQRDEEYFGPIVNIAARLQDIAQPGQTVMDSVVASDTPAEVTITPLGRHRVRDVSDEMDLFQLGDIGFSPLRTVDSTLSTLPLTTGRLIGRSGSVGEVRAALVDRRPVTIVGAGGVGKTRLAIEVAHLELSDHPDGCYFVDLAGVNRDDELLAAVARSSRIKLLGGEPVDEIAEWFEGRKALLVLDNCEHLIAPVNQFVDQLMMRAPDVGLLATSRQPLAVSCERVVRLGPLPSVEQGGPAVEIFVSRVRDELPQFQPDDTALAQIVEICRSLDGIPLALELAAARARVLGLKHLLEGMNDGFRLIRTLRETIDWSFGLLSEPEQRFFRACGVFNGTFDLRAAAAIVPDIAPLDVADLLHSLSQKSLLTSEGSLGGRFRLLETIREYALMRLREAGAEPTVRRLHFDYFHQLVGVRELATATDLDRGAELTPEWLNIAAALDWGTQNGLHKETAEIACGGGGLWENPVSAVEGRRWIRRILPELDPERDLVSRSILGYELASLEVQLDNFPNVHPLLKELGECAIPEVAANSLAASGYLRARQSSKEALELLDACGAMIDEHDLGPESRAAFCWARGSVALYEPDVAQAHAWFKSGFSFALEARQRTLNTIYSGLALATVQILMGCPEDSLTTLDSYDWDCRYDSSAIIRAAALIDLGRAAEAADLVFEFADESLLGRLPRMSNDALLGMAALALHRGEPDHAWTLLQQAVTPRTPFTIGLAEALAGRIGPDHEQQLRSSHRNRSIALSELDAIDHLRLELDRLSAGVGAQPGHSSRVERSSTQS